MPCRYWRRWSDGREFKKQGKGEAAGLPFFYIFVPGVKFVPYGIQVFSPSCRVARPGVGVGGLCRFPAGGVGVRSAHAARFGLVAAGRRHGFAFPDHCGRCGAARLRAVGLGRPEPLRVVARPLVCRAACGVAFRCAAHAALFRIRPASVRRYRNVYPGHCPECRMGRPVVPLPALSGALPCAGCRDVRGAPQPAPVVCCPDGRGVGDDDVGCAAGALGSGVRALLCLQSEKARCRVFVWHILGLKLAN